MRISNWFLSAALLASAKESFAFQIPSQIGSRVNLQIISRNSEHSPFSRRDLCLLNESAEDEQQPGDWDDRPTGPKDNSFLGKVQRFLASEEVQEDIKTYFISLSIALLLRFTIIEPRFIPSLSMFPTFEVGDQLAVEKVTKRIKPLYRQEVVVFNPPQTFRDIIVENYGQDTPKSREALIKRIVAIEVRAVYVEVFETRCVWSFS